MNKVYLPVNSSVLYTLNPTTTTMTTTTTMNEDLNLQSLLPHQPHNTSQLPDLFWYGLAVPVAVAAAAATILCPRWQNWRTATPLWCCLSRRVTVTVLLPQQHLSALPGRVDAQPPPQGAAFHWASSSPRLLLKPSSCPAGSLSCRNVLPAGVSGVVTPDSQHKD